MSNPTMNSIFVTNRHGQRVPFDPARIRKALEAAARGYEGYISLDTIMEDFDINIYDGMSTTQINKTLTMVLASRIEQVPEYGNIAARVILNDLSKDIFERISSDPDYEQRYRDAFRKQLYRAVEEERLDPRLLMFDIDRLSQALKPERDSYLTYLSVSTLKGRYLLHTAEKEILELPQYFWMRVAMGLSLDEKDRNEKAIEFYNLISELRYVPSTPTLLHSGTTHPQMSSCYIMTVSDRLNNIFKTFADQAQLSKWSGGVGSDWSSIRATGAHIHTINTHSQGVIPFLKIVDSTTAAINRSGKRRGATCVYLEAWHHDIEDFLELRKNTGDERRRTHDISTANWIPDLFMKRVIANQEWTLFSPDEAPDLHELYGQEFEKRYEEYEQKADRGEIRLFKRMPAMDLWRKMLTMIFSTGHPWITFKDPCNVRSPQDHVGVVRSSNLCTEITLNTSEDETAVCNLGSVNLSRHVVNGKVDRDMLRQTVLIAMRALDNVIDLNFYPTAEAKNSNMRHRPVGLGIMGVQDALIKLGMHFDSDVAVQFSDELQEYISYYAIMGSSMLAREKGTYSSYRGSKWDRGIFPVDTLTLLEQERGEEIQVPKTQSLDWSEVRDHVKRYGIRNSNTMAIAPTATIANISGCFPTTEPMYKNMYVKSNQAGEYTIINTYLVDDLRAVNKWNIDIINKIKINDGNVQGIADIPEEIQQKYKGVFEIDPIWVIRHASRRGKWIDQSQSINLFSTSTSGKFFSEMYINAWKHGLKTTYYLRTLAASQVDRATVDTTSEGQKSDATSQQAAQQVQPETIPVTLPNVQVPEPVPASAIPAASSPAPTVAQPTPAAPPVAPPVAPPSFAAAPPLAAQAMHTAPTSSSSPMSVTMQGAGPGAMHVDEKVEVEAVSVPKLCKIEDPTCESCQ